jgi:hypothetical protein
VERLLQIQAESNECLPRLAGAEEEEEDDFDFGNLQG